MIPWDTSYSLMTLLWRMLVLWVGSLLGCWHCLQCGRGPAMLVCAGSSWQSPPLLLASASPALAPVTLTIPWLGPALAPATSLAIDAIVPWSPHSHFSWPHASLPALTSHQLRVCLSSLRVWSTTDKSQDLRKYPWTKNRVTFSGVRTQP